MSHPVVSVIIVSRGRPAALIRCLAGLAQQFYPSFEVIVVSDPVGIDAVTASPYGDHIKTEMFDEANISAARNKGIARAAGEIVAFIDDDAVPEPTWLTHLIDPFVSEAEVAMTGGFVRGRNGISFQWKARSVDGTGATVDLAVDEKRPTVLHPIEGRAIKTEGTNMAVRREVLTDMGGFDPAFHYYLDETDLNMRMAHAGHATAIVPLAEVHHGYLANATRHASRAPKDLFDIGASFAVYLRKHCPTELIAGIWTGFQKTQRSRLLTFMETGEIEPRDVRRLLGRLRKGYAAGQARMIERLPMISRATEGFQGFPARPGAKSVVLSGRRWQAEGVRKQARQQAEDGAIVSLFLFSPTSLFHHVRFHQHGYWEQIGGIFGRSDRNQPLFRLTSFVRRLRTEILRVADQRRLSEE